MIHGKRILTAILFVLMFFSTSSLVFASSSEHVLPYPSFMPGNKLYAARVLWEKISFFWYFGSFAQFKYNLNQSDKYLVEAKTLFEYDQYLLGWDALKKSDSYFDKISESLEKAKQEQKDITRKKNILHSAAQKHIEVLEKIIDDVPQEVEWKPEKTQATKLFLHKTLINSVKSRRKVL